MAKVGNPYHDPETGEFTSAPGGTLQYSKLSKQQRVALGSSAFKTRFDSTGRAVGEKPRKYLDKVINTPEGKKFVWKENARAVALQTARALDRDAHRERDKAADASIKEAIAKHQGAITKVPMGVRGIKKTGSGKPRNPGKKQRIHGYSTASKFWK